MELLIILVGVLLAYEVYNLLAWKWCVREVSNTYAHPYSPNTLLIFNPSFRIEKAINYAIPVSEYHEEELKRMSLWELFPSLTVKILFDAYKKALLNKRVEDVEFTMMDKEGKINRYQAKFIPLRNGRVACMIDHFPLPVVEPVYQQEEIYRESMPIDLSHQIPQPAI